MTQKNVCIIGSGNWGSAIAKIIGNNVKERPEFNSTVKMYMYEELVDGKKLTEIVNSIHENVKYLPGIKLPENVVAISNLIEASTDADILVFVLPHQFIREICKTLKDVVKSQTIGVSLIKGFEITSQGINLVSRLIGELLNIECAVLMGANLAHEVAEEKFCETTIGAKNESTGKILKLLFKTSYFRCTIVRDADTVELCGALKNVVAIGAGIVDGLNMGDNTKAAVIRLGLMEMISFTNYFFPGAQLATFFESCGVADLIATCHGGRNRLLGECVVESKKSIGELEEEILHGQSFQGPLVAKEVFKMLKEKKMEKSYPLFTAVHLICQRELEPRKFTACLRNHPEHM